MKGPLSLKERMDDFWVYPKLSKVNDKREYRDDFFQFLQQPSLDSKAALNLYIHIPFCDSACIFCPYYKVHGSKNLEIKISEYIDTLIAEMKHYASTPYFYGKKIDSVHFGGGNPLLMQPADFERIILAVKTYFQVDFKENWSVEGSINCVRSVDQIRQMMDLGINRISFGIQTFKEDIRKDMNMRVTLDDIYRGVDILNSAGLTDYCIDMMYNMPNQSIDDVIEDLEKVTALNPYHIDIYNMAVFPNTYLDRQIKKGAYRIKPSNPNQLTAFREAHKWLKEHGYQQITTNTYSLRQKETHIGDRLYLTNNNVLGIGVSSRGYLDGYVYKNVCDMKQYTEQVSQGLFPANLAHKLTEEEHNDRTMVFFPITLAISKASIPNYAFYEEKINTVIGMGLAEWTGDTLKLTEEGIVWAGNIAAHFISEERWNTYMSSFFQSVRDKTNFYNEDDTGMKVVELEV
ncbi:MULTISPECIES: coproporphyrinogen-III oxidase family protein [unclassified Paenibacillus]|uniref:coproporphyrinogen-III oxidase family protein n=1 Tax=unclassified Paenibacillus TaxID=185978 RepID=UPI0030F60673